MKEMPDYLKKFSKLTNREIDIISFIAQGYNSSQIAEEANISYETVSTHRRNILSKTKCGNMAEVAVKCLQVGLIDV